MALMIPERPRDFDPLSLEGEMFKALSTLPDDYYVIHSFRNVFVEDNVLHESEADFVVFNPRYGILCIEAKAGQIKYQEGVWKYASGLPMRHGGPYNQASQNKWDLLTKIQMSPLKDLQYRCKLLHAVWFPSVEEKDLFTNRFPSEFDRHITLTMEALKDPQKYIDSIFNIELENGIKTNLSDHDVKRLVRDIICPEFDIFPSSSFDVDLKNITFNRLLDEQKGLLNYLVEQKSAVINGLAGTGKTMIAVEKATRHANDGEKVLFLCYNSFLREHLSKEYANENIDFMTIDGFACKVCKTQHADYHQASNILFDMVCDGFFPYKHVIVDEGQDFGKEEIEEADFLQTIHDAVADNGEIEGTFYVFYDKLQLIQSGKIPSYIADADCKLTLYKNCRNTEYIAKTSLKPIPEKSPVLRAGALSGTPATLHFCKEEEQVSQCVDKIIEDLKSEGITDVVILTCNTEDQSVLKAKIANGKYKKILFTTCRKFKGLEADAVILLDIDEELFVGDNVLRYYVGASRAKIKLDMVTRMDEEACKRVLYTLQYDKKIKKPMRELAIALDTVPIIEFTE